MPEEILTAIGTPQPRPKVDRPLDDTNWPKVILAAVLGLGLLTGATSAGYWYGTRSAKLKTQSAKPMPVSQPTPTSKPLFEPTPTPTPDPTANWKTYRNEDHSFLVKYPATFSLSESILMEDFIVDFTWIKEGLGHKPGISIRVINAVGPAWTSVQDYFEKEFLSREVGSVSSGDKAKTTVLEKTKIEGFDTVRVVEETVPGAPTEAYYSINTYIYKGGKVYKPTLYATTSAVALEKEDIYNQILSTFKFLD